MSAPYCSPEPGAPCRSNLVDSGASSITFNMKIYESQSLMSIAGRALEKEKYAPTESYGFLQKILQRKIMRPIFSKTYKTRKVNCDE